MTHYSELPPPLIACLYCHTEGTITEHLPQFWQRSKFPRLMCEFCGSIAEFDNMPDARSWRIRYVKCSNDAPYYYAHLVFEAADWLSEDEAIDLSTDAYVQRRRNEQVRVGQLAWLQPTLPDNRPASLTPDEHTLAYFEKVALHRQVTTDEGETIHDVDQGALFLTDRKLHIHGQQRDWSYEYGAVVKVHYDTTTWHVSFSDNHFIKHTVQPGEINAQITCSLIEVLRSGEGHLVDNR
jgi:hypothetical protein